MKRQKPVPLATKLLVWSFSLLALVSCSEDQSLPEQRNVPQLLQAGAGDGQIALNWLEVTGAHTYTVYWSTEQAQHLNKYTGQAIRVNQNSYVHLGLNNGVTYRYVVTATTDEGESKESNLAEATPQRTPPAKPSSILSKGEDQRVTIRWSAVNRAQRYDLVWDTNSSLSTPKRIQNIQAPYVLTGLSNGRTVYFQLVAVNSGGEAYSDTSSVTPAPQVPTAPIGLGLTVQDNGIELSWRQVSNAVGYDLLWSLSSGVDTQSNRIAGVTPPYVHAPVANGQTYYYRLRAANAAGYSVLSGEMSATAGLPGSEAVPSEGAVPAEPAGLLMTVGSGQLDLTWQLRQGARGYNLYWATESTPGIPPTIDTQSNRIANILPPYTHIGLINGERYYYRVSAINDSGESPLSPMVSQIPEVLEPGVPSNVTALGGDANIAIRWNRVRDAQSYTLYYQPDGGTVVAVANLTEPLYMINGLANGTLYHLQVSSTHAQSGESPRSEQLTVTPQVDPVSAPVQVQAIPGESQVLVRFDTSAYSSLGAGKAVQSYRLYYSTSPGAQSGTDYISIDAVTITTDTASYLHSGLTNGRRYYYTISAVNAGGESALSREVWAQPQVAVPGAPRNVEVQENDSELTLFWQVPEGAVPTNYNVYWSQTLSNGQRTQPVVIPNVGVEVSAGQYQFTITGLVNNTQYYVQVKAFNDGGEGLSSTELGAIPHIVAPSGVPTSLSAQAQANQVSLSWDWDNATQGSAPPHYRLYWSTQSSTSLQNSAWIDGVQPGYVHQGLTNGQAYYYRVAALNDGGEGPVSTAIQAVPLPDPPGQVNGFQVQGSDAAVVLTWNPVSGADAYNIYWSTNPGLALGSWNKLTGLNPGDQHLSLENGLTYYYVVTAVNLGGESDSSVMLSASPQIPAPSAPQGLAATSDNTQVIVAWETELGLSYNLYWVNNAVDDPYTQGQVISNIRPAYLHSGLVNNTVYRYVVTAVNAGGESAPSQVVRATPQALQTGAPAALVAVAADTQVTLSWQAAPSATVNTRYTLYVSDSPGTGTAGTAIPNVISPYIHTGLNNGTQYYYVVTAIEDVESAASNEATAMPMPPEPSVPVGLAAIGGDTVVTLSWSASENANAYTLFWDTVADFSSAASIPLGNVLAYRHSGLSNGVTYYYRLRAHNGPSSSAFGYTVSTVTVAPVVNTAPLVQIDNPAADISIIVGQSVNFQSTASDAEDDADGRALAYQWDFGSNSGLTSSQVADPGPRRFQTPGGYTVSLTVTDSGGLSTTVTRVVNVLLNSEPNGTILLPTQNVLINTGESVNFSGQGLDPDNHNPLSYSWRFGNNSGIADSNLADPGLKTFNYPGIHIVRFTVSDALGLSDSTPAVITVQVNAPPLVQIDSPAQDLAISQGQSVDFQATASDPEDGRNGLSFLWNFGTGSGLSPSTQEDPGALVFNNIGTHQVTLIVTDQYGAQSRVSRSVSVDGVNQNPTINSPTMVEGVYAVSMDEDGSPVAFTPININATDPEAQNLSWRIAPLPSPQPQLGTPSFSNTTANGSSTTLNYAVNTDANGVDQFDVEVQDGFGGRALLRIEVNISAQNDQPSITTNQLTINEGQTLVLNSVASALNLEADDVDNTAAQLIYNIVSVGSGQFETVSAPGTAVTSFTHQQVLDQQVQFVHNDGDPAPSYSLTIEDSSGIASSESVAQINFTALPDTTPDPFSFIDQAGATVNTFYTSSITVTGINRSVPISISGGEYAIDGGAFTSLAGNISNGQTVAVRLLSPATLSATTNAVLSIGGVSDTFSVSTLAADTTPDVFTFTSQTNAPLDSAVVSNAITVNGINTATSISITGGEYSIGGAAYTSAMGTVNNGQSVTVRLTSSAAPSTTTTATLSIGGVDGIFSVTTSVSDSIPDAFGFTSQTGVELNTQVVSNAITVSGINVAVPISIAGGQYSVDGGAFTTVAGTITNGQTVAVRLTSAAVTLTDTTATITIGGVGATFTATTGDNTPNAFGFPTQTGIELNTQVVSNAITVTGIDITAPISIAGGQYAIDGGAFTTVVGTITSGQTVTVRLTSASVPLTDTTTTLTIGGVSGTFTATTGNNTPNAFGFITQTGIELNTQVVSNAITVTGIDITAPISIAGGQYAIDGGAFTTVAGTITSGQTVVVRLTSASVPLTDTTTTLTIGGVSGTFTATTGNNTPNAFGFTTQTGIELNTQVVSNATAVTGINIAAPISIAGGQYAINGAAFTTVAGTITNGQTVTVRITSASVPMTDTFATVTIGGVSGTFTATTGDNTPNAFGFTTQTGIELNTQVVSNATAVTGINIAAPISIAGGQYSINGAAFTTVAGTISNGQTVAVRLTSASVPLTDTIATVTIGGVSGTFTAITGNNTPNAFGFTTQTGIELNTQVVSNATAVTGINIAAPISIAGGQYSIDGGAFTTVAGTISNGQTVAVRLTSASVPLTDTTATVTIGGVSGTFTATTGDNTPNAFGFTTQTGIELNTQVVSNATAVTGINIAAPISIVGGQYAIDGGAFTTVAGTISNGQTVAVRLTSASVPLTDTFATVTIGGVSGTFTAITGNNTPNTFGFTTQTGIELNTQVESNATAVTGINIAAPISIAGGQYSIDGGAFTTVAGTITNGQTVAVRLTSAGIALTDTTATVTIGGVSGTFTVTTGDNTPNAFGFTTQMGIELNTQVVSNTFAVSGINIVAPISIAGGQYSIDGGAFTTVAGTITNGQTVAVRLTSASVPQTDTTTTLTIGGGSGTFTVTTGDNTPNAFSFTSQTGVPVSTQVVSNSVTITGIDISSPISIVGGEYSIDAGAFTTLSGTITNGQVVAVRVTSASVGLSDTIATLTIGGVSANFTVTTAGGSDTVPDPFSFTDQTGVSLSAVVESNAITVSGITAPSAISIVGGEYSIDGAAYTAVAGTVNNGQSVTLRLTTSASAFTATSATLTIGGVSDIFTATTGDSDTFPDAFVFSPQSNVLLNTFIESNSVTVTGITAPAIISVTGGEYSINGGAYTQNNGTVSNGQTVTLRQTSSPIHSTATSATLNIGGLDGTFTVTTETQVDDGTPNAFSFSSRTNMELSTLVLSSSTTVSGINIAVPISIVGGEYSIDGGAFTSAAGMVTATQLVRVRLTSASTQETAATATLTIGGVDGTFTVTTRGYRIGGTISGLASPSLELNLNGSLGFQAETDGAYAMGNLTNSATYEVTVSLQPTEPDQVCNVSNGSGTIGGADITNVIIDCTVVNYSIGGNVSGLSGSGLALQINGAEIIPVGNGVFGFSTTIPDLSRYDISISSQPTGETCVLSNAYGIVRGANVSDVTVQCNPTGVALSTLRPIQDNQAIVINFDQSMAPASLVLGGDLSSQGVFVWSTTTVANDTLTFTPTTVWSLGMNQTLSVDVNNASGQPIIPQSLAFDVFNAPIYFVSGSALDDTGDGLSPVTALRTLQVAINNAVPPAVVVANAGDHNISAAISLRDGVSLYGGYKQDFKDRDVGRYVTDVLSPGTNNAIVAGNGVTSSTTVDGLSVHSSASTIVSISSSAEPVFRNNTIVAETSIGSQYIMRIIGSSPVIESNTLLGSRGRGSFQYGVYITGSGPILRNNTIVAARGFYVSFAYGVYLSSSTGTLITGNLITPLTQTGAFAYAINSSTSVFEAYNNIIHAGDGSFNYGLNLSGVSSPIIRNNIINGGTGAFEYAVYLSSDVTPFIDNNILYTTSNDRCVHTNGAGTNLSSFRNNDLYSCSSLMYFYVDGSGCAANDICPATIDELNTTVPNASSNVSVDPLYESEGGLDGDVSTPLDNDWHFSLSSPISVTQGGLNGIDDGGWGFNSDKDGIVRPATGSPWSIGPYEP